MTPIHPGRILKREQAAFELATAERAAGAIIAEEVKPITDAA